MKILQVNTVCKQGSTGKIAHDLHIMLKKDGHSSLICYGRGKELSDPELKKVSSDPGVYLHALITRVVGITGISSNIATNKLINIIKNYTPDVVHLHNLHGYYVNIYRVMSYLKKNNIKTIWTFHDDFMFTGMCGFSLECENWVTGCGNCPKLKDYPASMIFDFTRKQNNFKKNAFSGFNNLTIVTPSEWLKDSVKRSFLCDKNVCVIHNGINTREVFYPRPYGDLIDKLNIGNKSVLLTVTPNFNDERKGGKYVLQLAEELKEEDIIIVIVGYNGPSVKLPDNVIAVGRTENQEELASYYSMADVFLITSQAETFSMVCVEAMACGTPVVGFDCGAPKEIVPEEFGMFVPYQDIKQLKTAVIKMLEKSGSISRQCAEFAAVEFSIEKMYETYLGLYLKN